MLTLNQKVTMHQYVQWLGRIILLPSIISKHRNKIKYNMKQYNKLFKTSKLLYMTSLLMKNSITTLLEKLLTVNSEIFVRPLFHNDAVSRLFASWTFSDPMIFLL